MDNAIEKVQPLTQRGLITKEALKVDTEQRALLAEYVQRHMVKGTDFGVIPGTDKPTLLKPGAEKLVDLFRCTPQFKLVKCDEDFERGFFNYQFRVRIVSRDAGAVLAEGYGSANSREGRYRWRNANRKCPNCGKETIIPGKKEYGGGWLCFAKKGGCGVKFPTGAQEIEGQQLGKVENDDIATLANSILKVAKKRALVDGAIALARCSDMFTQDVEDFAQPEEVPLNEPPKKKEAKQDQGRAKKIRERILAEGFTKDNAPAWIESVLGEKKSSAQWVEEDMDRLDRALEEVPLNLPPMHDEATGEVQEPGAQG